MKMKADRRILFYLFLVFILIWSCQNKEALPILGPRSLDANGDTLYFQVPDFAFFDQDSNRVSWKTVPGKIVVADFFFTSCPTICPVMKRNMKEVYDALKGDTMVVFLSYSIDPEHDSVKVLKDYADGLGVETSRWHFLTGSKDSIYSLALKGYMVAVQEDPQAPGGYVHSGLFILLDPLHRIRGYYDGTNPEAVQQLVKDIQRLKREIED